MSELIFKYLFYSFLIILIPVISLLTVETTSYWQRDSNLNGKNGFLLNFKRGFSKYLKSFFKYDLLFSSNIVEIILPVVLLIFYLFSFTLFPLSGAEASHTIQILNSAYGSVAIFIVLILGFLFSSIVFLNSENNYARMSENILFTKLISFFLPLLVVLISIFMHYNSFDFHNIVKSQEPLIFSFLPSWGIFYQPLGAAIFLIVLIGLSNSNLVFYRKEQNSFTSGLKMSVSSFNYNIFMIAENLFLVVFFYLFIFLFLGGYGLLPGLDLFISADTTILVVFQVLSFLFKLVFCLFFTRLLCRNLPLLNIQKIINIGWKGLLPLSFLNFFIYTFWKTL